MEIYHLSAYSPCAESGQKRTGKVISREKTAEFSIKTPSSLVSGKTKAYDCQNWHGLIHSQSIQTMNPEDPRFVHCLQDPDEDLMKVLYQELKKLAYARMAAEREGHTLGPTALVHEAWLRLEKSSPEAWRDRSQFFAAASEAMRRILVESARRRLAIKRGSGTEAVPLEELEIPGEIDDEKIIEVHEALHQLAKEDPLKAQIVKLRFFSGMEHQEIATLLNVNEKTVRRHWALAKVRLYQTISEA